MLDDIVHMGPMLGLAGLMAGWVAEASSRAGGYGFLHDVAVGLAGSVVAGAAVWTVFSIDAGMPGMFGVGFAGAALAIAAQRMFWRAPLIAA
ncbi:MAG: hypothetical protein HYU41_08635 [Candidatus Rokubacteria bacterium]|nr:hypothetical protein [Candidatus Rokubacteria bacterium]